MSTFTGIILIALALAFWVDSLRTREAAIRHCRNRCRERGLQLLDQTIALARIRLRWTTQGLRFQRVYRFEYSEEGMERWDGHLTMLGARLQEFSLGLPSPPAEETTDGEGEADEGPAPPRLH